MINKILLKIPKTVQRDIWTHLLPKRFTFEEAAFLFARREFEEKAELLSYFEWAPVPPNGFLSRSAYHFELTDKTRAIMIKRAYELGMCMVEFHSHKECQPAQFSISDLLGFREFVPHVWWRLKRRPYAAVVLSRSGFDGLVWIACPYAPQRLDGIVIGKSVLIPTRLTPQRYDYHEKRKV